MLENMHSLKQSTIHKHSCVKRNLKPDAQMHHSRGVYLEKATLHAPKYNLGLKMLTAGSLLYYQLESNLLNRFLQEKKKPSIYSHINANEMYPYIHN